MPSLRLYPLLLAGAACLTLAACGSDDDPPQASAPAQAESAAPTQTAPAETPTTTAPDSGAPTDGSGSAGSPNDTPAATPPSEGAPGDSAKSDSSRSSEDKGSTGKGTGSSSASGGRTSSDLEIAQIHATLVGLQEAFAARNGKRACAYLFGVPEKADPKNPGLSCESLSQGDKTTLSEENRKIAATAKVTVNGRNATAELGPGVPLKLRKIDGQWRVDYTELAKPAGAAG